MLQIPFGIIDLSLAPTPAVGDSVADILCEIGLEYAGAPTPGPLTPTLITASASVTPWKAPAINGLSSGALQKTTSFAKTGEEIEQEFAIPIVNKRIAVTPIALVGGSACKTPEDFASIADILDYAVHFLEDFFFLAFYGNANLPA